MDTGYIKRYIKSWFVTRGKLSIVCNNKYETSNWKNPFWCFKKPYF